MRERWGDCRGRTVAFVGDGNNVATSLAHVACMLGVTLHVASPAGYELPDAVVDAAATDRARRRRRSGASPIRGGRSQASMPSTRTCGRRWARRRRPHERRRIFAPYQVNAELMAAADRNALFMHCLPAHRGEEVTSEVIESPASVVFDQAENRLHTQKALLSMLVG